MNYRMSDIAAGWGLGVLTCVAFAVCAALSSPKVEAQESREQILERAKGVSGSGNASGGGSFKGRTGGGTPSGAYGFIIVDTPQGRVHIFSDYVAGVKCYARSYDATSLSCVKVN